MLCWGILCLYLRAHLVIDKWNFSLVMFLSSHLTRFDCENSPWKLSNSTLEIFSKFLHWINGYSKVCLDNWYWRFRFHKFLTSFIWHWRVLVDIRFDDLLFYVNFVIFSTLINNWNLIEMFFCVFFLQPKGKLCHFSLNCTIRNFPS